MVKVTKAIFGFAVSPRLWWTKFAVKVLELRTTEDEGPCKGQELAFRQSVFDPALFVCSDANNTVRGLIAVHVDDLLIGVREEDTPGLAKALQDLFPYGTLEKGSFEYCGKEIRTIMDQGHVAEIRVSQKSFVEGRLDPVDISKGESRQKNIYGEDLATYGEKHDNRSAVGGLGWLTAQSRPDLAFLTSECQRHQDNPTLEDVKLTNKMMKKC